MRQNSRKKDQGKKRPYTLGPVVAAFQYRNDLIVVRRGTSGQGPPQGRRGRIITRLSRRSLRRLCFVVHNSDQAWQSMMTLTYPEEYPTDGKVVKRHLNAMLGWLRYNYPGLGYLWYLEFQERGAPHVHILLTFGLPGCRDKRIAKRKKVAKAWYRIVDSGDVKHLLACLNWDNARKKNGLAHYVAWYAGKAQQKQVPEDYQNVGRFWGKSRNITCTPVDQWVTDEATLRACLHSWDYLPPPGKPLYRVLYNASDHVDQAWKVW